MAFESGRESNEFAVRKMHARGGPFLYARKLSPANEGANLDLGQSGKTILGLYWCWM